MGRFETALADIASLKSRLFAAESYIEVAEKTVHFTVDEVRALLARIEKLEEAATQPAPKPAAAPAPQPKNEKADKADKADKAKEPK